MSSSRSDQSASLRRTFWVGGGPVLGLLLFVAWLAPRDDFRVAEVTRDVQALADLPVYTGGLSTLGLLLWSASAAMCFLTYAVLRSRSSPLTRAFGLGGTLTLLLLLDDAFMLHEAVLPGSLGLSGTILYGLYAVIGGGIVLLYGSVLMRTPYALILLRVCFNLCLELRAVSNGLQIGLVVDNPEGVRDTCLLLDRFSPHRSSLSRYDSKSKQTLSLGVLGISLGVDGLGDAGLVGESGLVYLAEDGSKLIGIVLWTSYVGHTCVLAHQEERSRTHGENGELSRRDPQASVLPFSIER